MPPWSLPSAGSTRDTLFSLKMRMQEEGGGIITVAGNSQLKVMHLWSDMAISDISSEDMFIPRVNIKSSV